MEENGFIKCYDFDRGPDEYYKKDTEAVGTGFGYIYLPGEPGKAVEERYSPEGLIRRLRLRDKAEKGEERSIAPTERYFDRLTMFCPWLIGREAEVAGILRKRLYMLLMAALEGGDTLLARTLLEKTRLTERDIKRMLVTEVRHCVFTNEIAGVTVFKLNIPGKRRGNTYNYCRGAQYLRDDKDFRVFIDDGVREALDRERERAFAELSAAKQAGSGFYCAAFEAGKVYFKPLGGDDFRFLCEREKGQQYVSFFTQTLYEFLCEFDFALFRADRWALRAGYDWESEMRARTSPMLAAAEKAGDRFTYLEMIWLAGAATGEEAEYLNGIDGGNRFVPEKGKIYDVSDIEVVETYRVVSPFICGAHINYCFSLHIGGVTVSAETSPYNFPVVKCSSNNSTNSIRVTEGVVTLLCDRVKGKYGEQGLREWGCHKYNNRTVYEERADKS